MGRLGMNSNLVGGALVSRAVGAGVALSAGVAVATGIFIAHISQQYAAAHSSTTVDDQNQGGSLGGGSGSGQLSNPQKRQAPVGGSHGS